MRPIVRYLIIVAIGMAMVCVGCLLTPGQAVSLEISGHSSGAGLHTLHFAGDLLNATITQGNNSSAWLINATGASA